jgi:Lipase (class 3)
MTTNLTNNASTADPDTTYFLACCSNYAYEDASTLSQIFANSGWTFETANFIEDTATSTQCFIIYAPGGPNRIVLAFRGTQTEYWWWPYSDAWKDILRDLNSMYLTPWSSSTPDIKVATGFKGGWDSVKTTVLSKLQSLITDFGGAGNVQLYVTGHSLGAALATLAVVDIYNVFPHLNLAVYTYASPVAGNKQFADMFNALVNGSSAQGFTSEYFLDPTDPIETWANWYLTCTAVKLPGEECFVRVNNQRIIDKDGTGHSILNYIALLTPTVNGGTPAAPPAINGQNSLAAINPMQRRTSFLAETAVSTFVIRTYTSPTYSASTTDKVYFWYNVNSSGQNGQAYQLIDGNHDVPFQRGYIDTFSFSPSANLSFGDFTRCKITKSPNENDESQWELQGLQIILNGQELFNNANIFTLFNNENPDFLFSGINPNKVAVGVEWGESDDYDTSGLYPSCTMDTQGNVVEVHKGANSDKLYYRRGKMNDNLTVTWDSSSHDYDSSGTTPSVAINENGVLIEVHKGANGDELHYRVGRLGAGYKVDWEDSSHEYDTSGQNPRVAIRGDKIVEVHKGKNSDELYYHVGVLSSDGSKVDWSDSDNYDSSGSNPSVAITADLRVLEVHKGANSDKLYYRAGKINNNKTITWDESSHEYDSSGNPPTVAVDIYGKVLEVHEGANTAPLHYRPGTMGNGFTVDWASSSQEYDTSGTKPVVAINDKGQVVEVHKGANSDKLYYHAGKWIEDPFKV